MNPIERFGKKLFFVTAVSGLVSSCTSGSGVFAALVGWPHNQGYPDDVSRVITRTKTASALGLDPS